MSALTTPHYSIEDLGDGVQAAIARREGFAVCNSGIVDLGEGGLVFDTSLTPASARDLRTSAEKLLRRPPSVVVISHRHLDHALGNSEFPGIPIWGTRRAREVMLERRDETMAQLTKEQLEKDVREIEALRERMRTPDAQDDLEFTLQITRALLVSAGDLRLVPPDRTFETRVALPGRVGAELASFGAGHTEADAVMVLPRRRLVFAGDLVVVGVQPSMGNGDPEHWLTVLDEVERLGPEIIVPGHGPVTTLAGVEGTRSYVAGVLEAARASTGSPLPAALRRWEGSLTLEENLKFARQWVADHDLRR